MTPEIYETLLWSAGSLLAFLLSIIGYFLNKHIKVIETLVEAVNSLTITVKLLQNDQHNSSTNCFKTHHIVDQEMKYMHEKILAHEILFSEMRIQIANLQKNHNGTV